MRRMRALLPAAAILIAAAALIGAGRGAETTEATTFDPTLTASVVDATPGAHSDITYLFEIDAPDAIFQDVVTFLPPEFEVARDADVPDGAVAGELEATATLGLINGACNSQLPVVFTFQESTTDVRDLTYGYGTEDIDGNGLIEFVEHYPPFLTTLFPGVQPIQRLYGQTIVAGTVNLLNFLIFEPGAAIPFFPEFDEELGYPTFAILNDPLAPMFVNPITDFCTPLSTTTTVFGVTRDDPATPGNNAGIPLRTNPAAAGSFAATSFVRSLWDADGDGIESNLDPCHYDPDTVWDPRVTNPQGDADGDGLPAICDPDDSHFNPDQDGDQFYNRHDLCPLVPDWAQDSDVDDVGDACDRVPNDPADGGLSHRHVACDSSVLTIGAAGPVAELPCPDGPDLPALLISPSPTVGRAGDVGEVGAQLLDKPGYYFFGSGLAGVNVDFVVTGVNPAQGSCVTNNNGNCQFNFLADNVGLDTITVTVPEFGISGSTSIDWKQPPANDDFADAVVVDALPFSAPVNTALAAAEPAEPYDCLYGGSVWYTFTPAEDTFLDAAVVGDEVYGIVGVYEGDILSSLTRVRCSEGHYYDYRYNVQQMEKTAAYFLAEAGTTYYFSVSAFPFYYEDDDTFEAEFTLTEVQGVVGDLNCDGDVGPQDSLLALRIDAGLPVNQCGNAIGDTNCDGEISAVDSLRILIFDAGRAVAAIASCPVMAWSGG